MTDTIVTSDPIIVHDQRPTHREWPDWLHEAKQTKERAWKALHEAGDEEFEKCLDNGGIQAVGDGWEGLPMFEYNQTGG